MTRVTVTPASPGEVRVDDWVTVAPKNFSAHPIIGQAYRDNPTFEFPKGDQLLVGAHCIAVEEPGGRLRATENDILKIERDVAELPTRPGSLILADIAGWNAGTRRVRADVLLYLYVDAGTKPHWEVISPLEPPFRYTEEEVLLSHWIAMKVVTA